MSSEDLTQEGLEEYPEDTPKDPLLTTPTGRRRKSDIAVNHNQMIDLIAESSGYYKYEVEDILNHLAWNIKNILKNSDKFIELKNIGRFQSKIWPERMQYSGYLKKKVLMPHKVTVKFTPSPQLRYEINTDDNGNYYDKKLQAKKEKQLQYAREYRARKREELLAEQGLSGREEQLRTTPETFSDSTPRTTEEELRAINEDKELQEYIRERFRQEGDKGFTSRTTKQETKAE